MGMKRFTKKLIHINNLKHFNRDATLLLVNCEWNFLSHYVSVHHLHRNLTNVDYNLS